MPTPDPQFSADSVSASASGMFLRRLKISNFRSCYDLDIEFRSDLTALVGENNSGKSSVIDALRLVTSPLSGRRTRYFESTDFSHGCEGRPISMRATYDGLTDIQKGLFHASLDTRDETSIFTTTFTPDPGGRPHRPTVTAGPANGPDADPELRDRSISHVYLAPLRDAQRELDSADGGRLLAVIQHLTEQEARDEFIKDANRGLEELNKHSLLTSTTSRVQHHVSGLTGAVRDQAVSIEFSDYDLRRLVRGLRLKMAEVGMDVSNLADSGLGYANLVFIATVLLELQSASESDLTLFLVEEPEAHLHPQLQTVLLDYLCEHARDSVRDDTEGPAGRIQVIVSSHSPSLASSVPVENVVVLRSRAGGVTESRGKPVTSKHTHAIPVASLGLSKSEVRKVNQYLDVTKASLLFAQRVILVEGIAEAVLLPALARRLLRSLDSASPRLFSGVTVVAIGGVDFKPYIRLLLTQQGGSSILDKLVIITDGDPLEGKADSDNQDTAGGRREHLMEFAASIKAREQLCVFTSQFTLEADLCAHKENRAALETAFLEQHPRSNEKWQSLIDAEDPAAAVYRAMQGSANLVGKGEFAHSLAMFIEDGGPFKTPSYLEDAIRCVLDLPPRTADTGA